MPLYEYECTQCKLHTEKIQKFSDPEITACPHCGGLLERVVSAPAISFKGGGWFADGYGNAKPGAKSESKGDSNSPSASPDSANSSGKDTSSSSKDTSAAPASTGSNSAAAPPAAVPAASSSEKK